MALRRFLATAAAFAAALAAATPASAFTTSDLKAVLAREMRAAPATSGAYVRDLDSGAVLFAERATTPRIPASVEKLFTTSSALLRLGPATTLQTVAATAPDAAVDPDGTLHGDLVLVGGGDPFFGDASAARLARGVRAAGIRRIDGAVVGDESAFDARRSGCCAGYDPDLGGVLSALAYDRGIFAGHAQLSAARFAATRFTAELKTAGVTATGTAHAGAAPAGAKTIASLPSRSVAELARYINVPSNNFAAEMLFRDLGARFAGRGTLANGAAVVRATVAELGVHPHVVDGSGLSRNDRTSPREVVRLLEQLSKRAVGKAFRASLAVTGRTGTVKARMRGTPADGRCQVKTGTLRLVSGLSGYCHTAGGRDVVFSFMSNRANTPAAKAREDRMAAAIARLGGTPTATPAAPTSTSTSTSTTSAPPPVPTATTTTTTPAAAAEQPAPRTGGAAPQP
jgi:D-alanyl-D-alanine carboxypeptidase/D-alanyl-D-alanine-endopeptidase (penicillin-binding protein 4)